MTIETVHSGITYSGNGATTEWDFTFLIPYQANGVTPAVRVRTLDLTTGEILELVLGVDFSISGVNNRNGGSVVYPLTGSPLDANHTITIERDLDQVQGTDVPNQAFYPNTLEQLSDLLMEVIQQVSRVANHGILHPTVEPPQDELPPAILRVLTLIGYDEGGILHLYPQADFGGGGGGTPFTPVNQTIHAADGTRNVTSLAFTVSLYADTGSMDVYFVPANNMVKTTAFILKANNAGANSARIYDGLGGNLIAELSAEGQGVLISNDGAALWNLTP